MLSIGPKAPTRLGYTDGLALVTLRYEHGQSIHGLLTGPSAIERRLLPKLHLLKPRKSGLGVWWLAVATAFFACFACILMQ